MLSIDDILVVEASDTLYRPTVSNPQSLWYDRLLSYFPYMEDHRVTPGSIQPYGDDHDMIGSTVMVKDGSSQFKFTIQKGGSSAMLIRM